MTVKLVDSQPGTIISIALHIFRSEPKEYLSLAGLAFLWSLLPIYGWAKSNQMAAVISVKAYQKLVGIEESTKDIARRLNRKLWSFWALNILGGFYVSFVNLVCLFILFLLNDLIFRWADKFFSRDSFGISLLLGFMTFLASLQVFLLTSGLFFWLYGRVCFAELPLGIEPDRSVFGSIARSWHLSRGRGRKIQTIFSIGSIILSVLLFNLPSLFFTSLMVIAGGGWLIYIFFWSLFVALLQILKAVIYYDLRCFREGIDLRLAVNK